MKKAMMFCLAILLIAGLAYGEKFPAVPDDVSPTEVSRQRGEQKANYYIWSNGTGLYVRIEPITDGYELKFYGFDEFFVIQNEVQHDNIVLYDSLGRMYDSSLELFSPQTFEFKDSPEWEYELIDPSKILTVGHNVQNGDLYSWVDITPNNATPTNPIEEAVQAERAKWDVGLDGKIGLPEAIRALQVIAGIREE